MVNEDEKSSPKIYPQRQHSESRATTENRGTRLVNLPLAGTFQQEVFYARKLKPSLNKRLELRRAVMQKGPKIGRRPLWDDQSAEARARRESSNRRDDGTYRRADPIALVSPILGRGVNAAAAGGGEFRIVMRRKPIDCVRAPLASITRNTEGLTDQSSLSTNLLRRSALSLSDLGIHCASRTMLLTKQRLKMSIARAWRLILELPIATILAAP